MAYYVKVGNPREFRRDILEASKKVIGCLQANRNVQFIRQKKLERMQDLQEQMKELGLLFSKLDDLLPDKELREEAIQHLRQLEEARKQAIQRSLEEKREQEEAARVQAEEDAARAQAEEEIRVAADLPAWHEEEQPAEPSVGFQLDKSVEPQPVSSEPIFARLPDTQSAGEDSVPIPVPEPAPEPEPEYKSSRSESDKLQSALASIEQKLASLE